ncbi:hypothetical protein GH740_08585 [Microbacterium sp. SYP-A9085]|uniref:helicase-associated domain-containing protein n=1 Tax=Microbacterium sp. SYP-A9085 TaxID=2664454 RepID=UPI00132247E9|nr:hypothetical protein [Microbacterium sp. SYP-A9085]
MSDTSDERALARRLAQLAADGLAELLHVRGVSAGAAWRDCFDAAEALLEASSIDQALAVLPRPQLQALAEATADDAPVDAAAQPALDAVALLHADGRPLAAVAQRLVAVLDERPDAVAAVPAVGDPAPADDDVTAACAERATSAVRALTDLVAHAADQPVPVTGAGAVTAVERRALIEHRIVADGAELDDLLALASAAGLLTLADRAWRLTETGAAWLPGAVVGRWAAVATGWRNALPAVLRTRTGGYLPPAAWAAVVPLDPQWPALVSTLQECAARWALIAADGSEPAWAAALRRGDAPDVAALTALLPREIDRIYLQADLTAIAPGPLRSALDLRLRTMALRESQAQASTYRFTADTLAAAVAGGEDAASVRAFLSDLSLTGIPQPLDYLIEQAAARHGLVRVGTDATTGRTRVVSADAHLLRTIAVDQSLRSVGLARDGDALVSRVSRDAVFWSLADARYPVVAVDAAGLPEPLRRGRAPHPTAPESDGFTALLPLALQLLANSAEDADAAWLERELEQAVRTRSEIDVTVRMPDGSERLFTMEATGLGGGRLRGRDRAADIERTVPVASIVGVKAR